ncbi:solute carrier family 39 fear-of-intimacy [Musca autumnalis]|uniref:solute carrier family 39 fear-of-intimacy n=1 Tax=Musca autumnalis TaxID=221902 RepID=UPI003CF9C276
MARHIMAVCVVCLLCADHLPCQQHVETLFPGNIGGGGSAASLPNVHIHSTGWEQTPVNAVVYKNKDVIAATSYSAKSQQQHQKHTTDTFLSTSAAATTKNNGDNRSRRRKKRHADHGHGTANEVQRPEITETFVRRIFSEYGNGGDTINVEDFQRMLEKLGLHQLLPQKLLQNHEVEENESDNETCIRDSKLISYVKPASTEHHDHDGEHEDHNHHHHHEPHSHKHHHDELESRNCSDASEGCTLAHTHVEDGGDGHDHGHSGYFNYTLTHNDIVHVCPVLLYQLTSQSDANNKGCIEHEILRQIDEHNKSHGSVANEDIMYVWIYSFAAVFACSILGLVGVAIIPFMNSRFYKHIIQFLVALAVGTMTGDALLHLLPHSLAGQNESNMIFKGLTCMGGIVFFYIMEHGLTMVSEWRKNIAKKETNKPTRAKVMRDPDSSHNNSVAGDKVCKSKYSSYPYCYDEIAMDTKNDVWLHLPNNKTVDTVNASTRNGKLDLDGGENATQSLLSTSQNNYAPLTDRNHHHHHHQHEHHNHSHHHQHHHNDLQQSSQANSTSSCQSHNIPDSSTLATDLDGNVVGDSAGVGGINTVAANSNGKDLMSDTVTVILREHESSHHGHSHKHGHVHSPPESLSAVVWMIIMGDGLHNFTDGMAIGAAFAENLAGGFSTALAVFCHELPHELGDFAILIKAGMSVKSAVYYNLLTGVLSFIGMIVGIIFGQSHETAQWMFAAAAGLFIYIAMVDMMPEISAAHKSVQQFALQILGMSSGVLLMLLIAIYEGDLMNIFSTN